MSREGDLWRWDGFVAAAHAPTGAARRLAQRSRFAEIDKERTLPDVLSFDPSKPATYPNGRVFTDDVINYRLAFLTKNQCPPSGLKPHTDILTEFPYIGTPHSK